MYQRQTHAYSRKALTSEDSEVKTSIRIRNNKGEESSAHMQVGTRCTEFGADQK